MFTPAASSDGRHREYRPSTGSGFDAMPGQECIKPEGMEGILHSECLSTVSRSHELAMLGLSP